MTTYGPRSIYSGPIRRALGHLDSKVAALDGDVSRWNSAWGIVGMGVAPVSGAYTVPAQTHYTLFNPVPVTLVAGRRYRFTMTIRAIDATNAPSFYTQLQNGPIPGATPLGWGDPWFAIPAKSGAYANANLQWLRNGDGGTYQISPYTTTLNVATTMYFDQSTHFTIEDIGPVSGAVAIPNPTPAWINMTLSTGWTNLGGNWQPAQYRKVGDVVELRGLVSTTGTAVQVWNPIPVGYGPPKEVILSGPYAPTGGGPHAAGRVDVYPTFLNTPAPVNYVSLTGLSWSVTA